MKKFILGKKLGMTTIYSEDRGALNITLIECEPNFVSLIRTEEKDKYSAALLKINKTKNSNWLICLYGNLGSGKTTFVQGLAEELRIKEIVNSPTFLIMKKYNSSKKTNKKYTLYHFDCYRISDYKEILDLGLEVKPNIEYFRIHDFAMKASRSIALDAGINAMEVFQKGLEFAQNFAKEFEKNSKIKDEYII